MKKILIVLFLIISCWLFAGNIRAEEKMVLDTTDTYLGGCQLTNKAEWELDEDIAVSKFQIWYSWNQGETTLPVTVKLDGEKFAEFEATRAQCDPYQHQWCNADYQINKTFPKGKYSAEIPESRMCLKPGDTGTVRLYSDSSAVKKDEPTPTAKVDTQAVENQIQPTEVVAAQPASCPCNQTTILITAAGASVLSSLIFSLLFRR